MTKPSANCVVRLSPDLHRQAKLQAFMEGKKLQSWVADLISMNLKSKSLRRKWICQECGKWSLKDIHMALLKDCEKCGKQEVATFLCEEK